MMPLFLLRRTSFVAWRRKMVSCQQPRARAGEQQNLTPAEPERWHIVGLHVSRVLSRQYAGDPACEGSVLGASGQTALLRPGDLRPRTGGMQERRKVAVDGSSVIAQYAPRM